MWARPRKRDPPPLNEKVYNLQVAVLSDETRCPFLHLFVNNPLFNLTLMCFWCHMATNRAVSAALHTVLPNRGAPSHRGPNIQTPDPLATQRKLRSPEFPNWNMKHWKSVKLGDPLKEKCLYITVNLGPIESKVFTHCNCCWGNFETKVAYL